MIHIYWKPCRGFKQEVNKKKTANIDDDGDLDFVYTNSGIAIAYKMWK